jgi:hypothetical protein
MTSTTYWLNRKAFRDSVNYGNVCPSVDNLSLGDSVWTRTVDDDGLAVWGTLMTTRLGTVGLAVDIWGDDPVNCTKTVLVNTMEHYGAGPFYNPHE